MLRNRHLTPDQQRQRLAVRINVGLMKLFRLQRQLQCLSDELQQFERDYIASIAGHLRDYIPSWTPHEQSDASTELESVDMDHDAIHAQIEEVSAITRQIYRKLARHCHPDVNSEISSDAMHEVNRAYEQQELGSLMMLCSEYMDASDHGYALFSLEDMKHYHHHIQRLQLDTEARLAHLEISDINRLRSDVQQAKLQGRNLAGVVAIKMRDQLRAGAQLTIAQ